MRFSINKKEFGEKLLSLINIVPSKSNMMTLSNFKIDANKDTNIVTITATDLNITAIVQIPANVLDNGTLLVSAKSLADIVNAFPEAEIKFSLQDDLLFIECENSNFKISYIEPSIFPEIQLITNATEHKINADNFKKLIENCIFCVSTDIMQSVCNGVYLKLEDNLVTMAATDTKRIGEAKLRTAISTGEPHEVVLPSRAMTFLEKNIHSGIDSISLKYDEHRITFTLPGITLISNKFEGRFPQYTVAFRETPDKDFMVDKNKLRDAIRRVSLLSEDEDKSIKISLLQNEMRIESGISERGNAKESISPYKYEGAEVSFTLNAKFISSFLNVIESDEVIFKYISPEKPIWVLNNCTFENLDIRFIVMPMRDRSRI